MNIIEAREANKTETVKSPQGVRYAPGELEKKIQFYRKARPQFCMNSIFGEWKLIKGANHVS
jgi:hypothetical protein